jgi:hypothetical protein
LIGSFIVFAFAALAGATGALILIFDLWWSEKVWFVVPPMAGKLGRFCFLYYTWLN